MDMYKVCVRPMHVYMVGRGPTLGGRSHCSFRFLSPLPSFRSMGVDMSCLCGLDSTSMVWRASSCGGLALPPLQWSTSSRQQAARCSRAHGMDGGRERRAPLLVGRGALAEDLHRGPISAMAPVFFFHVPSVLRPSRSPITTKKPQLPGRGGRPRCVSGPPLCLLLRCIQCRRGRVLGPC